MDKDAKVSKLKTYYKDRSYELELVIFKHLIECTDKYKQIYNHAINKDFTKEELETEYKKEITDLYIALHMQLDDKIINERLDKFLQYINLE